MRLFLIGWSGKEIGWIEVAKKIKASGHEIVYWTCPNLHKEIDTRDFPGTIFHDHFEALAGQPARGVNPDEFPLPSRDLIKQFYDVESAVITMMNKRYENLLLDERKHLYYHILQYWHGVINKYNPEAIIFPAAPHTVYDYIIYEIAKRNNIRTMVFEVTATNDRILLMEDFRDGHPLLRSESWKNQPGQFSFSDLSRDLQDYCNKHRAESKIPEYNEATYKAVKVILEGRYGRATHLKQKMRLAIRSIKDFSFPRRIARYFINRLGPNLTKEYKSVQSFADFSQKFIYFPLAYQPEQTTVTQGGIFVDQLLALEILSSALPEDWLIYVKEHPFQWRARGPIFFSCRPRGYYESIARLKNVRIVPSEINTFELIHYAKATATVSGSAALETMMRSKPALLFGYVWFQDGPGIFRVNSVESCQKALEEIKIGYVPEEKELIKFLRAFDNASFHGYTDIEWREGSGLSAQENINNFLNAIINFLKK